MYVLQPTHDSVEAKQLRKANPTFGWCARCGVPWSHAQPHKVPARRGAAFPCCTACWPLMSTQQRVAALEALMANWGPATTPEEQAFRATLRQSV